MSSADIKATTTTTTAATAGAAETKTESSPAPASASASAAAAASAAPEKAAPAKTSREILAEAKAKRAAKSAADAEEAKAKQAKEEKEKEKAEKESKEAAAPVSILDRQKALMRFVASVRLSHLARDRATGAWGPAIAVRTPLRFGGTSVPVVFSNPETAGRSHELCISAKHFLEYFSLWNTDGSYYRYIEAFDGVEAKPEKVSLYEITADVAARVCAEISSAKTAGELRKIDLMTKKHLSVCRPLDGLVPLTTLLILLDGQELNKLSSQPTSLSCVAVDASATFPQGEKGMHAARAKSALRFCIRVLLEAQSRFIDLAATQSIVSATKRLWAKSDTEHAKKTFGLVMLGPMDPTNLETIHAIEEHYTARLAGFDVILESKEAKKAAKDEVKEAKKAAKGSTKKKKKVVVEEDDEGECEDLTVGVAAAAAAPKDEVSGKSDDVEMTAPPPETMEDHKDKAEKAQAKRTAKRKRDEEEEQKARKKKAIVPKSAPKGRSVADQLTLAANHNDGENEDKRPESPELIKPNGSPSAPADDDATESSESDADEGEDDDDRVEFSDGEKAEIERDGFVPLSYTMAKLRRLRKVADADDDDKDEAKATPVAHENGATKRLPMHVKRTARMNTAQPGPSAAAAAAAVDLTHDSEPQPMEDTEPAAADPAPAPVPTPSPSPASSAAAPAPVSSGSQGLADMDVDYGGS